MGGCLVHKGCDGVVECTALVLAEGCSELEGRLTLFGILDEIRPAETGETSFVVYTKFEGCEHATDDERKARLIITDEDGEMLVESDEYPIWFADAEDPATIVAAFDLPPDFADGETVLWVEAVLDDETLSQTAVRVHDRYSV
jgi:hypothetical protein